MIEFALFILQSICCYTTIYLKEKEMIWVMVPGRPISIDVLACDTGGMVGTEIEKARAINPRGLEIIAHMVRPAWAPALVKELLTQEGGVRKDRTLVIGDYLADAVGNTVSELDTNNLLVGAPGREATTWDVGPLLNMSQSPFSQVLTFNALRGAIRAAFLVDSGAHNFGNILLLDYSSVNQPELTKMREALSAIPRLDYNQRGISDIRPDSLVITTFHPVEHQFGIIREVDNVLRNGKGIQVAVANSNAYDIRDYAKVLDKTEATGLVAVANYAATASIAAKIKRHRV